MNTRWAAVTAVILLGSSTAAFFAGREYAGVSASQTLTNGEAATEDIAYPDSRASFSSPQAALIADHDDGEPALEQRRQAIIQVNEDRWLNPSAGRGDADAIEQQLSAVIASPEMQRLIFDPTSIKQECRGDMCRIETEFGRGASSGQWITQLLILMGPTFGNINNVTLPMPDGQTREIIYAYRLGTSAPVMPVAHDDGA